MANPATRPPRKWYQLRLAGRILIWVIGPMVLLIGINLFFVQQAGEQSRDLMGHQQSIVASDQRLMRAVGSMTTSLLDVNRALRQMENARREGLAAQNMDTKGEIARRTGFQNAARRYLKSILGFSTVLELTDLPQAEYAQYVTYLTRAAGQIDRMVSMQTVANSRTLRLAQAGEIEEARNNFQFEERMRSKAIQQTLDEVSVKFTELLYLISILQVDANEVRMAEESDTQARIQQISYMVLSAIAAVGMLAALLSVSRTIIRPIRRIPQIILNAGKNSADSANTTDAARHDEIGDILGAVQSFGQEIKTAQEAQQRETEEQLAKQSRAVDAISDGLNRLANGDLTARIHQDLPEGYTELRTNFNRTLETLSETIAHISTTSLSIKGSAGEISQGSQDLSERTESQAATLEETAAALDQMTSSVRLAADNARSVEATMNEARSAAETNRAVVDDAVAAMTEIKKSSSHISQIITVIDDISFQTNLLALNAGVEAARAGEAGRGFAVVASEVRALAQRSSDAAMEIKTLISNSGQQVENGVQLVDQAGEALQSIVAQVTDVSRLVSGIAEGAAEQSIGLNEINTGMTQIDQVTQQNATLVEETTTTSQTLNADAMQLAELVAHFQVDAESPSARPSFAAR
ncbi:methyl-accepting chemotaxis protein [Epibacterium ulvae]|uniref:methyl-accepting chemotaxis protein n=1 Tax=Epibacterium ulvae TaxID=1156985 RepID=UPI00203DA377|nr:methyl-accepting chemotaxis protein [Epibacterium ulvae]